MLLLPVAASSRTMPASWSSNNRMAFMENKGQITDQHFRPRNDIDFSLHDAGMNLFVGAGQLHYQFTRMDDPGELIPARYEQLPVPGQAVARREPRRASYTVYRLDMELVGASTQVRPVRNDPQSFRTRYYLASGNTRTMTEVQAYRSVVYPGVYPGIDWVLYEKDGKVKYDFILHDGADPSVIRIRYKGATTASLRDDGSLQLSTPLGSLTEEMPLAWTQDSRQPVSCRFVQKGDDWGFVTGSYSGALVLDPALKWGTYYGGTGAEPSAVGVVCAEKTGAGSDNIYIGGDTDSPDGIATTGAHQTTLSGLRDAFLAKFDASGALLWATYFGGSSDDDLGFAVTTDGYGHVYLAGYTLSTGLATPGAHQTSLIGPYGYNYYLARFDSTGQLDWATYYNRGKQGYKAYVATGPDGSVYLAGTTGDTSGIATPGAFLEHSPANATEYVAFLARFDSTGHRLWGTYYGGPGGYTLVEGGVAVDRSGNAYLAGSTGASSGISSPGAHQEGMGGGSYDAFLAMFDSTGHRLWGTYFGGSSEDRSSAVCADPDGNAYMMGNTLSTDSIGTAGASRDSSFGIGEFLNDNFVTRIGSDGQQIWGSYVGPVIGMLFLSGIAADECSNVYLTGSTFGYSDIQPTPDAWHDAFHPGAGLPGSFFPALNGYLLRYDPYQGALQYSTYFGEGTTFSSSVCTDSKGNVYLLGITSCDTAMSTPGVHQDTLLGTINMVLTKFIGVNVDPAFSDTGVCVGGSFDIPYIASDEFNAGNSFEVELSDTAGNFSFASPVIIGTVAATGSGVVTCTLPAGTRMDSTYRIRMRSTDPVAIGPCWRNIFIREHADPVSIIVDEYTLGASGRYKTYQWYLEGTLLNGATDSAYTVSANGHYTVKVTDAGGCSDSSEAYNVSNYGVVSYEPAGQVRIYPNPAEDIVYIKAPQPVHVLMMNMEGKLVLRQEHATKIDISRLPAGVYLLRVTSSTGVPLKTEQLVKMAKE